MDAKKRYSMQETGFTQVDNKIFEAQPYLSPAAFGVLMRVVRMIEGYRGNEETALSNTFLQTNCNISKNTVSKVVKELVEFGFLNQEVQQRKTAIYSLNYENIANFDAKKLGQNLASQNLASQNLTIRFPKSDLVSSQNLGSNKENINKTSLNKTNSDLSEKKAAKPAAKKPAKKIKENNQDWIDEKFEAFYKIYPNKKSKGQAKITWNHVFTGNKLHDKPENPEALFQQIIEAVKDQTAKIMSSEERFRKHPSTWLNAQAWLDEVGQPSVNHQSSKPQRTTPDPLAVNAKYDVPSEMTDEQKRAWFADSTDGNTLSNTAPDNSNDYYYG